MKKFSKILIFIVGLFFFNNSFGSNDSNYQNSVLKKLYKVAMTENETNDRVKRKKKIISTLMENLMDLINFDKSIDTTGVEGSHLFYLSKDGKLIIPTNWTVTDPTKIKTYVKQWLNNLTNVIINVFAFNNINKIPDLDEDIQPYFKTLNSFPSWIDETDKKTDDWILDESYKNYCSFDDDDQWGVLTLLNDLDGGLLKEEIIDLFKKLHKPIPEMKLELVARGPWAHLQNELDKKDSTFMDYSGKSNVSSKDVVQSFCQIAKSIMEKLQLSGFDTFKEQDFYNPSSITLKIGEIPVSLTIKTINTLALVNFKEVDNSEIKYFDSTSLEEAVKKIYIKDEEKEDSNGTLPTNNNDKTSRITLSPTKFSIGIGTGFGFLISLGYLQKKRSDSQEKEKMLKKLNQMLNNNTQVAAAAA